MRDGRAHLNWYFTTLLFERNGESHVRSVQRCHYLITADDHDGAYEKSMRHGNRLSKQDLRFAGVRGLAHPFTTHERVPCPSRALCERAGLLEAGERQDQLRAAERLG